MSKIIHNTIQPRSSYEEGHHLLTVNLMAMSTGTKPRSMENSMEKDREKII